MDIMTETFEVRGLLPGVGSGSCALPASPLNDNRLVDKPCGRYNHMKVVTAGCCEV
jgi:hypothetical protein